MNPTPSRLLRIAIGASLAVILVSRCPEEMRASPKKQSTPVEKGPSHQPVDTSQYVGPEACQACHAEIYQSFEKTPHWKTTYDTRRRPQWQGCEACHGPGKAHVDAGGDKTKIFTFKDVAAQKISERCLACHDYGEEHSNFARSAHNLNAASCIDCHSPHHATQPKLPIHLYHPYNNRECLHCHAGARSFEEAAAHNADPKTLPAIKSNTLSCLSSGCHEVVHNVAQLGGVQFWKERK